MSSSFAGPSRTSTSSVSSAWRWRCAPSVPGPRDEILPAEDTTRCHGTGGSASGERNLSAARCCDHDTMAHYMEGSRSISSAFEARKGTGGLGRCCVACLVRRAVSRRASRRALLRGLWSYRNTCRDRLSSVGRTIRGDLPSRNLSHDAINL